MSGSYDLRCAACDTKIDSGSRNMETLEALVENCRELEKLAASALDLSELRGATYEYAGQARYFVLDHWRHNALSAYYSNGGVPEEKDWEPLPVPPEAGIPPNCSLCHGRLLVPCPACTGAEA